MIRVFFILLLLAPLLSFPAAALDTAAARDSVGVERKNGKLFVRHKVEPKETLYALSRKYNVAVAEIVEANPMVENAINIGQVVLIPRKGAPAQAAAPAARPAPAASERTYTVSEAGDKIHVVQPKQTLYAISRMHGVSVEELRRWNKLADNSISVGAPLIVGKGVAKPTKNPVYLPEPDDEITTDKAAEETITAAATPAAATPVAPADERIEEEEDTEEISAINKRVERGLAEMIDPKADTNKYLALHKSAPVGTIMQVKNAQNGQVVYVRVIGKLPDTGASDNVIVRISKKACQKLGATDSKFGVELSYMP